MERSAALSLRAGPPRGNHEHRGIKQRLQGEEQRLSNRIDRADTNARDLSDGPSVREWGDASVRDEEKDGQFQEAASDLTTFKLVRDALKRIEEGTFGKCVVDSGPIEEKRLHAVPWTPYWLKHEQLLEKEHPRRMPTL
jgi:DnaK suppressor protein